MNNEKYAEYNNEKQMYEIITDRKNNNNRNDILENENKLIDFKTVFLLVYVNKNSSNCLLPGNILKSNGKFTKVAFRIHHFEKLSQIKISLPEDINSESSLKKIEKIYQQLSQSLMNKNNKTEKINYKFMDPIKDIKINEKVFLENSTNIEKINSELKDIEKTFLNSYGKMINLSENLEQILNDDIIVSYKKKLTLRTQIKYMINELNTLNKLVLNEELINMKKVLARLNYLDKNNLVTVKGQTACYITSGDTIILTEMLFDGFLNRMPENDIGVILSCFVSGEGATFKKDKQIVEEDKHLMKLYSDLKKIIESVVDIYIEYKINIKDKESYIKLFRYDLMKSVLYWINGEKTFGEICDEKISDIYEGSFVRTIRRLDELIKELILCADFLGNNNLKEKLENLSKKIKRGIPFTASLYLSEEK